MAKMRGSILIEVLVATFILFITGGVALTMGIGMNKSIKNRHSNFIMKESLEAICSEIKYNNSFQEVKDALVGGTRRMVYSQETLKDLTTNDFFVIPLSSESDNFIEIVGTENTDGFIGLSVKIRYRGEVVEQMIIKSSWMDEI